MGRDTLTNQSKSDALGGGPTKAEETPEDRLARTAKSVIIGYRILTGFIRHDEQPTKTEKDTGRIIQTRKGRSSGDRKGGSAGLPNPEGHLNR